jgi:hypothetical protein
LTALRNLALLLTALCLVPGGAHLAALPNKLHLPAEAYLAAQRAYDGWALFGVLLLPTIALDLAYALRLRAAGGRWHRALAAPLLLLLGLVLFFVFTFPANQATANWTHLPEGWPALRARWEWPMPPMRC